MDVDRALSAGSLEVRAAEKDEPAIGGRGDPDEPLSLALAPCLVSLLRQEPPRRYVFLTRVNRLSEGAN